MPFPERISSASFLELAMSFPKGDIRQENIDVTQRPHAIASKHITRLQIKQRQSTKYVLGRNELHSSGS